MTFVRRRQLLAAIASLPATPPLFAQASGAWPGRPVRIVVPAPPAGGTDILARLLAERLSAAFRQPFVIENKPGANGMIGSETVARAAPDGYTLLFSFAGAMVVSPALYRRALDPLQSFESIAQAGSVGNLLLASPRLPVRSLRELVAYARKHPGELSYGSWGIGSGAHLAMETFLGQAGIVMNHVPYKGAANVATDVLGGTLMLGWADSSSQIQQVKAGRLVALAVSGSSRLPQLPDVPTMSEQGYAFDTTSWYGLFAPAHTPAEIVRRLNGEVLGGLATPQLQDRLTALNIASVPPLSPGQFRQLVEHDMKTWHRLALAAGVKPE
ncbi:Bug family tripartite tricarboxylate transporter substrate binding protein [Cupriavidus sp. TMH.W2]|uniref:Bug family tripartite tricarboxylate transporter substrate binding protein n=1 Tax=Cupriavidus sp. TMH.W2 TaxID=3434465 RepID=UPI003D77FA8B